VSRDACSSAKPEEAASQPARVSPPSATQAKTGGGTPRRPSLGGGRPAQDRELRAQGRQTLHNLLKAGLAEFDEKGLAAVRVDDIVRRAQISHGTFYLYFSNKDDLFKALLKDAVGDMAVVADEFPVVTRNEAGQVALRRWVRRFSEIYVEHAAVFRTLSQAEVVDEEVYGDGLLQLFRLAEAMAQGMTAATGPAEHAELTAVACLMMMERVNYLMSQDVRLPREEMEDRIAAIIFAAFGAH
jgi:AcrR family transcriptional regulator